jgi:hypothetical protein
MDRNVAEGLVVISTFFLMIILLIIGPIFTIWSIQVIFKSETLEMSFESWCAALWLIVVFNGIKIVYKAN